MNGTPINLVDSNRISTNLVRPLISLAHLFHIIDRDRFCNTGKLWNYEKNDPAFFEVPKIESFDVDNSEDFYMCEALYRGMYC